MFRLYANAIRFGVAVTLFLAVAAAVSPVGTDAAEPDMYARTSTNGNRFLALGIGKSAVVDLPADAKDVLVANPAIANAVVRSARRAYLIGIGAGQTSVIFFDGDGRQIAAYDIEVGRDATGVREALRKLMPGVAFNVDPVGDSVVLTGVVANAADAQKIAEAAIRLVGDEKKVVNGLTIKGKEQVLIKVTVAEVERDIIKQLGIDLNGSSISIGSNVINFNTVNQFTSTNATPPSSFSPTFKLPNGGSVTATLRALEQNGVLRTLAEPTLTAISGESAKFLAGGEFPVPGGQSCDQSGTCQIQIQFKQFGVGLEFTPIVLSEGRISLKVATEVSELTQTGAIVLASITIPALKVRRANSTVELPSGGSLALAGLLQEQTKQSINGIPALMNLPVLGPLFKSRDYQNGLTELMILVTPYVVNPSARQDLALPSDGFADASDPQTVFMNQLNRTYGTQGADPRRNYHGNYGFITN
ncbi:MAG TPA: type II and III secretion system protein family protein [Xanthobacteraceae bacterium]|nr:type II and III secretion system protein family protein [Xanthobacteraceae bacterium]